MADRWIQVSEIAEAVGIFTKRVHKILHEKLQVKKLCARWVPQLLTLDQKRTQDFSKQCLVMCERNPKDFWRRFITVDETWIHHYTPETKQQSKQWVGPGERASKKADCSVGWKLTTAEW